MTTPNIDPIYTKVPDIQFPPVDVGPTANTALDGSGTAIYPVLQAGVNGSFVQRLRIKPISTTAATVMRVFFCSATGAFTAGTTNTSSNTNLIDEIALPANTLSQTAASPPYDVPLNIGLPPSTYILVTVGTSTGAAGTGFAVTAFGGDY